MVLDPLAATIRRVLPYHARLKHCIDAGNDPHDAMQWSGHRTKSMLQRYHIVDLGDLRRAGQKASAYRGPQGNVVRGDFGRTRAVPAQDNGFSSR